MNNIIADASEFYDKHTLTQTVIVLFRTMQIQIFQYCRVDEGRVPKPNVTCLREILY